MALSAPRYNLNLDHIDIGVLDLEREKEIKMLILGEPNAGKTSMINLFFNKENPKKYLQKEISPTIGADIHVFDYNYAKIGVFDLAGQELFRWVNDTQTSLFYETDIVVLCFNLNQNLKKMKYEETINQIHEQFEKHSPSAKLIIFLNKYDEFVNSRKGSLQKANKMKQKIQNLYGDPTYITSLIPNYYPLVKMKLERVLKALIPTFRPDHRLLEQKMKKTDVDVVNGQNHVVPSLRLADIQQLPQSEYDRAISRAIIRESEFAVR